MLGPILLTIHNLTYYQRLLAEARKAIENEAFRDFYENRRAAWQADMADVSSGEIFEPTDE